MSDVKYLKITIGDLIEPEVLDEIRDDLQRLLKKMYLEGYEKGYEDAQKTAIGILETRGRMNR